MTFGLMVDALIIVLLGATLGYGIVLTRRLSALRGHQSELQDLVAALNDAASRAEAGIAGLKANADQAGTSLQSSIDRARRLNEELSYRMERVGGGFERDEEPAYRGEPMNGAGRKKLEREILSALRAVRQ
jgi:hypothetical protein